MRSTSVNRADIGALLDHLGEDAAHVVGLSRGGMIALDFAIEFPDRVRSLTVAAGGVGGYESPAESPPETWQVPDALYEARDWAGLADWETAYWADGPGQPADRVDPSVRAASPRLGPHELSRREGGGAARSAPAAGWGRLGELRAPLLVLLGTVDDPGTSESMRHLAASVPGARLEEFEGSAQC